MFKGTYVALVTPFKNGAVDYDTLDKLVEFQVKAGIAGIVPCGTTGESPTLDHEEHDEVIARVIKRARGRIHVMAGTGSNSTAEAIDLTRHAERNGADSALLVAPYYNRPTQEGLYQHFKAIAESTKLSLVIYNIPGRCAVEIMPETIARLAKIKNINAVKHATGSMDGASALRAMCDIDILSGDDSMTLPLMSVGATGVISVIANIVPKDMKALTDTALRHDFKKAEKLHRKMFPLAKGMLSLATNPIPVKTAMAMLGMCGGDLRLPLWPMDDSLKQKLRNTLKDYGLLKK
ncbi:MAG: 4-hydroxy-tetrahydrodipicolinate synthase [Phycisphaerae bacterium]